MEFYKKWKLSHASTAKQNSTHCSLDFRKQQKPQGRYTSDGTRQETPKIQPFDYLQRPITFNFIFWKNSSKRNSRLFF